MQGNARATVHDVRKMQQYVLHAVTLYSGTVSVGDTVTLLVDEVLNLVIFLLEKFVAVTWRLKIIRDRDSVLAGTCGPMWYCCHAAKMV